jgi:hypothetical protein
MRNRDNPRSPCFDIVRAPAQHAIANARKVTAPAMRCTRPVVETVVGTPSGVPGGKPSIGSVGKIAAAIMPSA